MNRLLIWLTLLSPLICNQLSAQRSYNIRITPGQSSAQSWLDQASLLGPKKVALPSAATGGGVAWQTLEAVSALVPPSPARGQEEATRWYTVTFDSSASVSAGLLQAESWVELAEPVRIFQLHQPEYTPNDDSLDRQWYHRYIESQVAWDITRGAPGIRIGIIDTGIDYLHPEFDGQLWINPLEDHNGNGRFEPWPSTEQRNGISGDFDGIDNDQNGYADDVIGYDFADQPSDPAFGDYLFPDPDPFDDNQHGTLVAGVVGAKMDNQYGIAGIAPHCRMVVIRAFTSTGAGEDDDIARAIIYGADNGIPILNFSFGDIYPSRMMHAAIQYAYVRGTVMVSSAGNGKGDSPAYPSGFPEVISVSGTTYDPATGREFFWPLSSYGLTVDLSAPAAGILTTRPLDTLANGRVEGFTRTQGTSFAAPMVSAGAALIMSQRGMLGPEAIRGLLRSTTDDVSQTGWDHFTGAGRLNLRRLLQSIGNSEVSIIAPAHDGGTDQDSVWIVGTVLHPEFQQFHLEYQPGVEGGDEWLPIAMEQAYQRSQDTLALWRLDTLAEGEYTLRLRLDKSDGVTIEDRIRFVIDRTAPELTILDAVPAWVNEKRHFLVRFRSSDQGKHVLHYRPQGNVDFRAETADRFTRNEDWLLGPDELVPGTYEWYIESTNLAGLSSLTTIETLVWESGNIPRLGVDLVGNPIPMGRYLETPYDWDGDNQPEIVMSRYDESLGFGKMMWYEFNGSYFRAVDSLDNRAVMIPKGVADVNGDGSLELLASVNDSMYLFTPQNAGDFPKDILWSEEDEGRYAAGLEDSDGDGLPEMQARDTESFYVYEWNGGFANVATLTNPTSVNLAPGLAKLWTADTDGDQRPELLFGDADADLIVYEHNNGNNYVPRYQDTTDYAEANAETFAATGDFDGDGQKEWFAAVHSSDLENADGEYDTPLWRLRIYDANSNDAFGVVWEDYLYDIETKTYNAATAADLDLDPADELIFSTYPRSFILEMEQGEYQFTWYQYGNIQTQHVVGDFNGNGVNEFTLGRGDSAFFFEKAVMYAGPQPVTSLQGRVLGPDRVELTWLSSPNATGYQVLRLPDPAQNNLATLIGPVAGTRFLDQGLQPDLPHLFVLRSVNPGLSPDSSAFGNAIILTPHERPRVDSARALSARQVEVFFSQPVVDRPADLGRFRIPRPEGDRRPTAILPSGSPGHSLILTLDRPLFEGWQQLVVDTTFMDAQRGVLDPNYASTSVYYEPSTEDQLILTEWEVLDDKTARLRVNLPLDETTALDTNRYTLSPVGRITSLAWGSDDMDAVDVTIEEARFGALGYPLSITLTDVCAINDVCVGETGNTATFSSHKQDLSEVFAYPNPVLPNPVFEGVRFANLTRTANIEVYSVSGRLVKRLEETDGDGGLQWDLRDEGGYRIKPGIYLYRVYREEGDVEEFMGKFSLVE